jgi:hypothetical protein
MLQLKALPCVAETYGHQLQWRCHWQDQKLQPCSRLTRIISHFPSARGQTDLRRQHTDCREISTVTLFEGMLHEFQQTQN